jgi:hypothetical protein
MLLPISTNPAGFCVCAIMDNAMEWQRSSLQQVDNNEGRDFKLTLVDAPTEDEILDRRAREFEAAERDRLAQIAQAEAEVSKEVAAQREDAEGDAMHEWWRVRRAELRQQAIDMVQQELGGGGEGCADSMDVRYSCPDAFCFLVSFILTPLCCSMIACTFSPSSDWCWHTSQESISVTSVQL